MKHIMTRSITVDIFHWDLQLMELQKQNIQVVVFQAPMYTSYLPQRHPDILRRRDSVLREQIRQNNLLLFSIEEDTLNFEVTDFWNESHLNPSGAKKATALLDQFLQQY